MNTRQQKKMVRKLEGLRSARLGMAELQVTKARRAQEEAEQKLQDEQRRLEETVERSHEQYRELTQELQQQRSIHRETLYEWQMERKKVADGVDTAKSSVDVAEQVRERSDEALQKARDDQRAATLDVERTRLMLSKLP